MKRSHRILRFWPQDIRGSHRSMAKPTFEGYARRIRLNGEHTSLHFVHCIQAG